MLRKTSMLIASVGALSLFAAGVAGAGDWPLSVNETAGSSIITDHAPAAALQGAVHGFHQSTETPRSPNEIAGSSLANDHTHAGAVQGRAGADGKGGTSGNRSSSFGVQVPSSPNETAGSQTVLPVRAKR